MWACVVSARVTRVRSVWWQGIWGRDTTRKVVTCCSTLCVLHKTASCQKCAQSFYQYRKRIIYTKLPQYYFRDHFQGGSVPNNTLNSLFTSLGKVCVRWGVFCVWVSECTAHICQDHSQTPTLSLAARERERPMITSMCFQQTHVVLTLAKTTGAPFYTVLGWKTRTHAIWCFCNSFILGEVTTDVGCLFHLAATAPYRPDDVMFGLQMLWNQCWLLLH